MQRTEARRNGSELRSKAGQGVATAWHRKATRRHGTEEPSDGIAQLREGTEERRSAGYEQQRQGMAVKGAKRSGKATSAPRRNGKACQSIETAWRSEETRRHGKAKNSNGRELHNKVPQRHSKARRCYGIATAWTSREQQRHSKGSKRMATGNPNTHPSRKFRRIGQ